MKKKFHCKKCGTQLPDETISLDIQDILRRIVVSRPFTIYQLANLVINELPDVVRKFETKVIIIPDILSMFLKDPSVRIGEARPLIKDVTNSLRFDDM